MQLAEWIRSERLGGNFIRVTPPASGRLRMIGNPAPAEPPIRVNSRSAAWSASAYECNRTLPLTLTGEMRTLMLRYGLLALPRSHGNG